MENREQKPQINFNPTEEEVRAFHERVRREFTTDDLKSLFEEQEAVPAAQVLGELEAMAKKIQEKRARG